MAPRVLGLVLFVARILYVTSNTYPPLQLPEFKISDLQMPDAATLKNVEGAVTSLGMFAVTGFNSANVAHTALSEFASCAASGDLDLRQVVLENGALRRTLATSTNSTGPQPLPASVLLACPNFARAATRLRAAVAEAGSAYARVLDQLLYGDAACTSAAQCFTDAVHSAESLEHFHLFEPAATPSSSGHMLSMHSDIGLFLVMSAAELFGRTADDGGDTTVAASSVDVASRSKPQLAQDLVVQLADGRIVTPLLPDGALLVMNGEGLTRWMRMPSSSSGRLHPYSPMHEVLSSDLGENVRVWFGRMFMPPPSARLQVLDSVSKDEGLTSSTLTFADYRQHTYTAFRDGKGHEASTVGCSPTRRLLADEGSCAADQVYCWHSCMPITPNITCSKSQIICANINNPSLLWPQNYTVPGSDRPTHCKECTIMCPATPAGGLPPSESSFCNKNLGATTMWMTGFQFAVGNENGPCVVYLFPEWVLDSAGKFGGACIGTFFIGVLVGLLGRIRNQLKDGWVAQGLWQPEYKPQWRTWLADVAIIGMIALQVFFGYWIMLVAMTYQAELFIMVVLGLACGHLFNRPRPKAAGMRSRAAVGCENQETLEPCCSA